MKHPETVEGPEAWNNFDRAMNKLLSVSHEELMQRESEYQRRAKANPGGRRGPKPKGRRARP
jgi:hypothetical protein